MIFNISQYINIQLLGALCWGFVQAVLTWQFFPGLLAILLTAVPLSPLLQLVVTVCMTACTFVTFSVIGYSTMQEKSPVDIINYFSSDSDRSNRSLFLFFGMMLTTCSAFVAYEWYAQLIALSFMPIYVIIPVIMAAFLTFTCFLLSRAEGNISLISKSIKDSTFAQLAPTLIQYVASHLCIFYVFGIQPFVTMPLYVIGILVGVFTLSCVYDYMKNHSTKKTVSVYLDDLCNKWLLLTLHTSAEGVMSAAGFYHIAHYYIQNIGLLNISTAFILLLGTLNEELIDYVEPDHEHDAATYKDSITPILTCIDWLLVAILANYMTGSAFILAISITVFAHQIYRHIYTDEKWTMHRLYSAIAQRSLYYVCCITAMCISVNAGMEFCSTLGAPIYVIFAIMFAGTYVEGRVYFDQIYKSSDEHQHNELQIFSWVQNHIPTLLLLANTAFLFTQFMVLTTSIPISHVIIGLGILSYPYLHAYDAIAQHAKPFMLLLSMISVINISVYTFAPFVLSLGYYDQCIIFVLPIAITAMLTAYAINRSSVIRVGYNNHTPTADSFKNDGGKKSTQYIDRSLMLTSIKPDKNANS